MTTNSLETAHHAICALAKAFKAGESHHLSPAYQEAEVRTDFIDPMFQALGWDVRHERERNPYKQEVKVEKGLRAGISNRRADYAFHLSPNFRDPIFGSSAESVGEFWLR